MRPAYTGRTLFTEDHSRHWAVCSPSNGTSPFEHRAKGRIFPLPGAYMPSRMAHIGNADAVLPAQQPDKCGPYSSKWVSQKRGKSEAMPQRRPISPRTNSEKSDIAQKLQAHKYQPLKVQTAPFCQPTVWDEPKPACKKQTVGRSVQLRNKKLPTLPQSADGRRKQDCGFLWTR